MSKRNDSSPVDPTAKIPYRGFLICNNKLNSLWWISKGGFGVDWADTEADARAKIDTILGGALPAAPDEASKRANQVEMLNALMADVRERLLSTAHRWPLEWDGHELRALLAYAFNREISRLFTQFRGEGRKRRLAAQKEIANRDLY